MISTPPKPRIDLPGSIDSLTALDTVGKRIAFARAAAGLTQAELHRQLGKSRATIVQYEQDNINPPVAVVKAIADILNVRPEFLAFGRNGSDSLINTDSIVGIEENTTSQDGKDIRIKHYFSKEMLQDFKIRNDRLIIFTLKHDAKNFRLRPFDRVVIDPDILKPDRTHSLFLVRSFDDLDVIEFNPSFAAKDGEYSGVAGNGRPFTTDPAKIEIIGAIVFTIHAEVL